MSAFVPAGTVLLKDTPYAIVPAIHPSSNDDLICSNITCRRRVPQNLGSIRCPEDCIGDVIWCNENCKSRSQSQHDFEYSWLKRRGVALRESEGKDNFTMLWIILRILAARHLEQQASTECLAQYGWEDRFQRGYESIEMFRSNQELWPEDCMRHWKQLVETYFSDYPQLPQTEEIVSLICKEEANSFGLYPGVTGTYPLPDPPVERGVQYGLGVYPRATIANHSCLPNIVRGSDDQGRMVFTSSRDIAANEECLIAYLDLSKYVDVKARQEMLQHYFTFTCVCRRCEEEKANGHCDIA